MATWQSVIQLRKGKKTSNQVYSRLNHPDYALFEVAAFPLGHPSPQKSLVLLSITFSWTGRTLTAFALKCGPIHSHIYGEDASLRDSECQEEYVGICNTNIRILTQAALQAGYCWAWQKVAHDHKWQEPLWKCLLVFGSSLLNVTGKADNVCLLSPKTHSRLCILPQESLLLPLCAYFFFKPS